MKNFLLLIFTFNSLLAIGQTIILQPDGQQGKDSRIWSRPDKVDDNGGNVDYMGATAWTWDGNFGVMRMLVEFDLTALPEGAHITDAKLSMYHFTVTAMKENGDNALYIKRITSSWDESKVTWNNKPTTTEIHRVSVPAIPTGNNLEEVDVTALVSDMVADPSNSHGFLIMLQTEQTFRTFNAASSENTNASVRPKLVINYTIANGLTSSVGNQLKVSVYPNPYKENSVVNFTLFKSDNIMIEVFNSDGEIIKTIANQYFAEGNHSVILGLDNANGNPGIYLVRIVSKDKVYTEKVVIE